uniref:Acyltransferase 3 domain-containing protein n=1 Tax=Desulfovibrio sp. U5L TaxID=596152 RepID=I2PXY9_9BACT
MPLLSPRAADRLPPVAGPIDPDVSARIDVLRAVLIGLIVVCHGGRWIGSDVPFANPAVEFCLTLVNRGLDCVAVPLFFAISGFLLLRKLECSATAYATLLRRKFVAIGLPFLIFNAVWIVWLLAVGSIALFGSRSYLLEAGIAAKLFGLGTPPVNYPLWFLRDLLLVFALTPVFLVFYRRLPVAGLAGLLLLWLVGEPAGEYSLGGFAFAFYAGGFLARRRVNLRDTAGWDKYVLPLFAAGSVLVGASPWLGLDIYQLAALKKAYQIVGVAAFWCLSRQGWIKGSRALHAMAALSFFIFLTHEPTVSVLQSRLMHVWQPAGTAAQLIAYPVVGLAAILLLYGLGRLLAKAAPTLYAVLTGAPLRRRFAPAPPPRKPLSEAGSVAAGLCREEGKG